MPRGFNRSLNSVVEPDTGRWSAGRWFIVGAEGVSVIIDCELRHLRLVLATAHHRSFRGAALSLGKHPSCVSRRVRELEDHLGVSLFERCTSGVSPTIAGQRFLELIRPAVLRIDEAMRVAGSAGRAEIGTLRIGTIVTIAGGFLRRLVEVYCAKYPDVAVDIVDGGRDEHLAAIRMRELDVAFFPAANEISDCETIACWSERVHIALADRHPLSRRASLDWNELKDETFIVSKFEPGPEVYQYIVRRSSDYGVHPLVIPKPSLQETLMNLVALGQGITPVVASWKAVRLPGLTLRPLRDCADIVPFHGIWSPGNDNPALRRFLSLSRAAAKNSSLSGEPSRNPDPWR